MAQWTHEQVTEGLMAMITFMGNASAASRALKSQKGLEISSTVLSGWKTVHGAYYDELRDKYAAQLESKLANDYRDLARHATEVAHLGLDKTKASLVSDSEHDPARAAANAARVAQTATDKLLSLTGRPTNITETRNIDEILRSLAARKIIQIPDEPESQPAQIEPS